MDHGVKSFRVVTTLSRIKRPLIKADLLIEVIKLIIRANLFVKTFVIILKEQFNKLMGLKNFMLLASGSFGIRVRIEKLILYMS
jgi:flagellar biosynthesis protein FlhB